MSSQLGQFRSSLKNAWRNDRRTLLKSATAWVLFSAIIVVFVFWGLSPHHAGVQQGGTAAQVEGEIVSMAEYVERSEILSQSPQFAQLEQFGAEFARRYIHQQAIQNLIDERLLGRNLAKMGVMTSDAQVRDTIMGIQAFQEDGRFSHTRYLNYLQATRQEAADFEGKVRRQLAVSAASKTFAAALRPVPQEAKLLKAAEDMKANVEGVSVPTENLVIPETVSAADVKSFLATGNVDGVSGGEPNARIKNYYETHKEEFNQPERAKVRHILIKAEKGNAEAIAKAKASANDIAQKLRAGGDFAKVAKEKSDDPGSKNQGGLIDYFSRGSMVPQFEEYSFTGPIGKISDPIQTDFGFHIIKVEDRKAAQKRDLEDAKDDIAEKLIAQERTRIAVQNLEKALAEGKMDAVQDFVTKHKLKWVESGAFSLNATAIPKLGGGDDAVSLALKLTAAKPLASKLVRQGPTALILKYKPVPAESVADKKVADKNGAGKSLKNDDELRAGMEAMMAARRGEEVFGTWVNDLRKTAKISINPDVAKNTSAAAEE